MLAFTDYFLALYQNLYELPIRSNYWVALAAFRGGGVMASFGHWRAPLWRAMLSARCWTSVVLRAQWRFAEDRKQRDGTLNRNPGADQEYCPVVSGGCVSAARAYTGLSHILPDTDIVEYSYHKEQD